MSTTIDSRVVEMRFDNKHFEQNVQTSMSTLDKLKQKLHLDGATKGLENVNTAAQKVNFSGMTSAVETVGLKFNAMYSIADQALRNITNSAMAAGKRIVNALTIDPIKTGFSEYETKINAVQTIMSNTASKGTTMEDVTRTLNELNTYADKTIYNFAEMTRNIGTFTAAGVGLEESASAIQGIANLAAASGSTSQQASTAMYQLSQALAAGSVKLMDWNSVVNAGMGGEKFQEALKATAREHGIAVDAMIEDAGSFRESLRDEWITADVLNETLSKFTVEGAKSYAKAMMESGQYTQEQADALIKEAQAMEDAATKVKTFTQLWDTMKESVQSGWAQTWEIVIGDFEEAKEFLSGLSDRFGEIFGKSADKRNSILEKALGGPESKWNEFIGKINEAGVSTEDFNKALKETARESGISLDKIVKGNFESLEEAVTSGALSTELIIGAMNKLTDAEYMASGSTEDLNGKLKYFQKVVDEVWHGDFKNGEERIRALEEAGYDYAQVQSLVNKTVDGHKLTLEDLSDAQLINLGYTKEQITAIRKLAKEAENSGTPLNKLIEDMQKPSGRDLLVQSVTNALDGLTDACKAVKTAWEEIFPPKSTEERAEGLYGIIEAIHAFSESLRGLYDEEGNLTDTGEKLVRTLKGLFAIIDLITTITSGAFKIAFKVVSKLLSAFDMDILDLTAMVGDALVGFRDFIDSIFDVGAAIDKIIPHLTKAIKGISNWVEGLKATDNIPKYILEGLVNGLKSGATKVWNAIVEIGTGLLTKIKEVLGIHSPSREFYEIGKYIVEGLFNGISDTISIVWRLVKNIGVKLAEYIGKIDFGTLMVGGLYGGIVYSVIKLTNVVDKFAAPFEGLGDVLENTAKLINNFRKGLTKMMNAKALEIKSKALLNMAIAIGVLAASIWVLAQLDTGELWGAVAAIAVLAAVIAAMTFVTSKVGDFKNGGKLALSLIGVAAALLIMAIAMKKLSEIDIEDLPTIILALSTAVTALLAIIVVLGNFTKHDIGGTSVSIDKLGGVLLKISVALLIMVGVIKLASMIDNGAIAKGLGVIAAVGALFAALMFVSQFAGANAAKVGSMMISMSLALLGMIAVIKLAGGLEGDELGKGIAVVGMLGLLFAAMIVVSKFAGANAAKAGLMMLSMSVALLITVAVIKIAAGLTDDGIDKASDVVFMLGALFAAIILVSKFAGKHAMKAGIMLLAMSAALLIMVGVLFLLSKFKPEGLDQAMGAIEKIMIMFAILIAAAGLLGDGKSVIISLTIAIGLLVLALMALTFIDAKKLMTSVAALSIIILAFAALIKSASSLNGVKKMIGPLIAMMGVLLILAGIIIVLSHLDAQTNLQTALALSVLLLAVAASMKILSGIKSLSGGAIAAITIITVVVAGLAAILGLMSYYNVEGSISTAIAIGVLLNLMAVSLTILSKVKKVSFGALGAMAILALVVGELAIILGLMSYFDVQGSISTAVALGILLNAMATAMVILKIAGSTSLAAIGSMALMGLVVGELAIILGLMSKFDVNPSIETAGALSTLLIAMSASLILLGMVGAMGPAAFIGIGALATLIAGIGGLLVGIGALMDKFPQLEGFLDKGIPVMEKIGHALGSFFGNIVGGFLGGALSFIPDIGTHLSDFMVNLQPFLEGASTIDKSAMEGVKTLAETILILTGAGILDSLTSWFAGGSSLASFGSQFSGIGLSLRQFATAVSDFSEEDIKFISNAATAIKVMAEAADSIPNSGGWLGKLVGENDMDTFGAMLPAVGGYLTSFTKNLGDFTEDQVATVECASNAIVKMAEAADKIPNQGGWLAAIVGDNTIETFGKQLPTLGTRLSSFVSNLGTFTDVQTTTVECASNAIVKMAEAADKIPNQGGWLAALVGDNTISTFGKQLPLVGMYLRLFSVSLGTFGEEQINTISCASKAIVKMAEAASRIDGQTAWGKALFGDDSISKFATQMPAVGLNLRLFAWSLGTFTEDQVDTVECAATAIKLLAEAATHIDGQSEWGKWLFGDNGLGAFGGEMEAVGTSLKNFVNNLGTFTSEQVSTVNCAVDAIKTIAGLSGTNLVMVKDNLPGFGDCLEGLGDDITAFADSLPSSESITSASTKLKAILDLIDDVAASNASAAKNFTDSLKNLGKDGVASFVEAFGGTVAKADAKAAATELMTQAIKGLESKADKIKTTCTDMVGDAIDAVRNKYQSFYNAGSYLVDGFAAGISENDYKAEAKAAAMAKAAADAAEEALDINSPSKVFRAIGSSVPEGFALGIEKVGAVTSAVKYMAGSAIDNVKNSITRIADMVDGDMDTQPTIRPVLDLSDVRAGAGAISSLFGSGASVGVLTNVGAISNSMRNRQNGTDSELVSEIRKLRRDVGTISKPSYNINGITYDDGSNIADAVGALVRAAKVERRI